MKKLLVVGLAVLLLLGMVACGEPVETDVPPVLDTEEIEGTGTETEAEEPDSEPYYAYGGATVEKSQEVTMDSESFCVSVSEPQGGFGDVNAIKVFLTPRNMGKTCKVEAYVMPTSEGAAVRISASKKGQDAPIASAYFFDLEANEWNRVTLCYQITQENVDAGFVSIHIDQNVAAADFSPAATLTKTFYVDKVKASLFKESASDLAVYNREDFEDSRDAFTQYKPTSYQTLTDPSNEFKMGGNFSGASLKVGAWNWKTHSGNKAMVLYGLAPNENGSFGARVKLNNVLPQDLTPYIGTTLKMSAYVYMEGFADPTKTVSSSFGYMGDKTTSHLVYETYNVNQGEWTLMECELKVTEDFLKQDALIFEDGTKAHYPVRPFVSFGSNSSNYPSVVYIDDIVVECAMVNLPSIFADNMVLQQGKKVPVWGWGGIIGDVVTATVGEYSASATVDERGEFLLELPPMKAATDQVLTVRTGSGSVSFENVGIGEVWYCSGQSNMELKIKSVFDVESIVANADKYDVRSFKVSVKAEYELQRDVTGGKWSQVTSSNVSNVTAIGYIAAYQIQAALGVPVALIECYEGGSSAQAWLSYERLFAAEREVVYNDASVLPSVRNNWGCEGRTIWQDHDYYWSVGKLYPTSKSEGTLVDGTQGSNGRRFAPTGLYNAMQGPLANYAIAGVMWYQGESQVNARLSSQYNYLQYDLIEQWREDFRDPELPVMLVQLAPYEAGNGRNFFEIRQIQIDTTKRMDNVFVIGTAYEGTYDNKDVGGSIHPGTKVPVGNRMADTVLATVYDLDLEYGGPMFESMEIDGNKAILRFSNINSGLKIKSGDSGLKGFKISGDGVNFVEATATIVGDVVAVTASSVKAPVAVQYAYINVVPVSGAPDTLGGNLENGNGQPAFPFIATLGNAEVYEARAVDGKLNVEIWERGHNTTSYDVTVTADGVSKTYPASFRTAGNCVIETDISTKVGSSVNIVIRAGEETVQSVTVNVK